MTPAALLLLVCAALGFWILAGYPLWLHCAAHHRKRQPRRTPFDPTVTAVIPVHNGERFLTAKLDSVLASEYPPEKLSVLVLSDGSTDSTDAVASAYASSNGRVRFLALPRGGKAAAISAALPQIDSEVILFTDVRQRLEPDCLRILTSCLADPEIGVVSGNLKIRSGETAGEANVGLYWRYESWIRRNLSLSDSLLGATGPIYVMRRALARPLPKGCILDDVWQPFQAVLAGRRSVLAEDAVVWDYPTSLNAEFVRKVRTQAGLYQLLAQERRLLAPWSNRLWAPFLILKLGRLFLPHLLLAILISSFFLPAPARVPVLAAQAAFYLLALADRRVPEKTALKRLSGPVAAVLTLIAAAFCAQAIFFTDPARLWKPTRVRTAAGARQ